MEYSVSILIPTFNRGHLIKRAINSSLEQTFNCEIIVCDHGSNDETYEICKSYGEKINYIRRENDYGLHFCEIESLLAAKSDLIHFCFDDDWMHPKYIENSVNLFNEKIGMVYCNYELVNLEEELINEKGWDNPKDIFERLNFFSGGSVEITSTILSSLSWFLILFLVSLYIGFLKIFGFFIAIRRALNLSSLPAIM